MAGMSAIHSRLWILERCCSSPARLMEGAFVSNCCENVSKPAIRRRFVGGQRTQVQTWALLAAGTHTHTCSSLSIHSPQMEHSSLQRSHKVHPRTSTPLLPWFFARSLLRYRRSDSVFFSHARKYYPRPPPLLI